MPWDKKFECMPVEEMQKLQLEKLKETVAWVEERVPFYKKKFKEAGLSAADINGVEDIAKFPVTVKDDLRDNYPFGLCAVDMQAVVRVHASSGTTGKPITGPYTQADLDQWTECMARNFAAAGVTSEDIIQNAYGHGLFTGGLGFHQGACATGAAVVPTAAGMTERQIVLMQDFKSTVLCCTPSYALTIAEAAEDMRVDIKKLPLKIGIFGAEPWTVGMRKEIENRMGIKAHEAFGLTELGGPGVSFDCEAQDGLHINEDHYLAEVVDPETFEPLPLGEKGELIFTSLQRRAMPMIRYRTKDITRLRREACACGRTLLKMDKLSGRTDDMLIISGVNVFPSQVESVLLEVKEVEPQYVLVVRKKGYLDHLTVRVEAKREVYNAGPEKCAEVEKKIANRIKGLLGFSAAIQLMEPKLIERSEGKAKRIIDERPKE